LARAGGAVKGFAVVAGEVKNLSSCFNRRIQGKQICLFSDRADFFCHIANAINFIPQFCGLYSNFFNIDRRLILLIGGHS
jgi:hypothetical protein